MRRACEPAGAQRRFRLPRRRRSILLAFSETALRSATWWRAASPRAAPHHAVGRGRRRRHMRIDPTITARRPQVADTVESLLARVSEPVAVAAQ